MNGIRIHSPSHPRLIGAALGAMAACLFFTACPQANTTTPNTPAVPLTTIQRIQVTSAEIAKINNAFEQEVENLQASKTITEAQARPIIKISADVATSNMAARKITTTSGDLDAIAAELTSLLTKFDAQPLAKQGIDNQQLLTLFVQLHQAVQGLLDIIKNPLNPPAATPVTPTGVYLLPPSTYQAKAVDFGKARVARLRNCGGHWEGRKCVDGWNDLFPAAASRYNGEDINCKHDKCYASYAEGPTYIGNERVADMLSKSWLKVPHALKNGQSYIPGQTGGMLIVSVSCAGKVTTNYACESGPDAVWAGDFYPEGTKASDIRGSEIDSCITETCRAELSKPNPNPAKEVR